MERFRVKPGSKVELKQWNPADRSAFTGSKEQAAEELERLNRRLEELQELLYAEHKHKLLIVLQAMDTGGKDGVIRSVFQGVDPQGVRVANFKAPSPEELDHDYLWRAHRQVPGRGEIAIFNRSHYEDVLIVRVHKWITREVWQRRYDQINDFERMLAEEGATLVKFYLHISKDEQKTRLQSRLDEPKKRWKFNPVDLDERKLWPQYMRAYQDVFSRTSTPWAPWYIVPANSKSIRNIIVSRILVQTLEALKMRHPKPKFDLTSAVI
jgi:PPK2 family polyphosphate:nucleotide phosphotransferase